MAGEVRCAIIGIGSMGKKYAAMIGAGEIEGLSLAAVCCRSDANAEWAAENLPGGVRVCRSEDELYARADMFDAALIVTPHKLHPAMAIRAFRAGKHVMCDKPPGTTLADARAMNAAAAESGRVYAMMCHQRAYPRHRALKRLLDEGAAGRIERVSLESSRFFRTRFYHRSSPWRSSWNGEGGGALINQGYHPLDLWQYLFGRPQSIYAMIPFGKYNDFAVDDEATLLMAYPNRRTGRFFLTTGEGKESERLEIAGTKGRILLEDGRLTVTRFSRDLREYALDARVVSRETLSETEESEVFGDDGDAYRVMLKNFADAVLTGAPLIAPGSDGVNTIEIINAAYLSAWEGRRIDLPLDIPRYLDLLRAHEAAEAR